MVDGSAQRIPVTLVVNNTHGAVTGLSRYAVSLCRALQACTDVQVNLAEIGPPPFPASLIKFAHRMGLGLDTFFQTYPVVWPIEAQGIVHLTHRSQATLLWRKGQRCVVVTAHDIIHYQYRNDPTMHIYRHPVQTWFDAAAVRALQRADAVLASSEYTRQALINEAHLPPSKVHVIYPGVDTEQFQPRPVPPEFYARYRLDPSIPYILHLSTEEPRKNVLALVRAFVLVRRRHPTAHLLKIGRPLYTQARVQLLALIQRLNLQEAVTLIDDVPDDDLVHFYNAARVFAFPSHAEGFGFPVLEAMACGTPAVCANTTSLPEIAGEAALLIDPDDIGELAEAIDRLLSDTLLWNAHRQRSLQQATRFTWHQTVQNTVRVYAMTCGETSHA